MDGEQSLIFGINAVLEKLKAAPDEIAEILLSGGSAARAVESRARGLGVRVGHAKAEVLDGLAMGQRHQGVVARVAAHRYWSMGDLVERCSSSSAAQRVLILDGITDPRNFGALLRSADGAGVADVVIAQDRSASVTPTVIKASAGAAYHVRIYRVSNLRQVMQRLKDLGFWLLGLDAAAPSSIYDRSYPGNLGIVLGSEGRGMRPLIRKHCDFLVSIPMAGQVTSLNVAVAAAVLLYELRRQQGNVDKPEPKR